MIGSSGAWPAFRATTSPWTNGREPMGKVAARLAKIGYTASGLVSCLFYVLHRSVTISLKNPPIISHRNALVLLPALPGPSGQQKRLSGDRTRLLSLALSPRSSPRSDPAPDRLPFPPQHMLVAERSSPAPCSRESPHNNPPCSRCKAPALRCSARAL